MSKTSKLLLSLGLAGSAVPAALAHEGHSAREGLAHLLTEFHHYGGAWIALGLVAASIGAGVWMKSRAKK